MEHERVGTNTDPGAPGRAVPIRVALVGCSGVLGDIIRRAVREAPDMRVVSEASHSPVPGDAQEELVPEADVVLWNNADEEQLERMLTAAAVGQPPVLAALDDGRKAVLWRLAPHRTELGVLSPASLVEWIRSAALR